MKSNPWKYEIIYDRYNEMYFMARVKYDKYRPIEWVKVSISGHTLWGLSGKIEKCYKAYFNSGKIKRINQYGKFVSMPKRKKEVA